MFDPSWLTSFSAVAQEKSFSAAANKLNLQQSTVSQHISKLEKQIGRRLLDRDTHATNLTVDGEAMLKFAEEILRVTERANRHFSNEKFRDLIRFGVSDDFVITRLPRVLRDFRKTHPSIDLDIVISTSTPLFDLLDQGQVDVVLAKRRVGEDRGTLVCREKMRWMSVEGNDIDVSGCVPLLVYPPPSITRKIAIDALDKHQRNWTIPCVTNHFSGLWAAALAGLGVLVQAESVVPPGLNVFPAAAGLPELDDIEFVVASAPRSSKHITQLVETLIVNATSLSGRWLQWVSDEYKEKT